MDKQTQLLRTTDNYLLQYVSASKGQRSV